MVHYTQLAVGTLYCSLVAALQLPYYGFTRCETQTSGEMSKRFIRHLVQACHNIGIVCVLYVTYVIHGNIVCMSVCLQVTVQHVLSLFTSASCYMCCKV